MQSRALSWHINDDIHILCPAKGFFPPFFLGRASLSSKKACLFISAKSGFSGLQIIRERPLIRLNAFDQFISGGLGKCTRLACYYKYTRHGLPQTVQNSTLRTTGSPRLTAMIGGWSLSEPGSSFIATVIKRITLVVKGHTQL